MTGTVQIRPVDEDEREAWNPLWAAYLAFYKTALTQDVSDLAWMRFHDPDEPMFALGGYLDGKLVGFAHYLFHRSTWAPHRYCYLEGRQRLVHLRPPRRGLSGQPGHRCRHGYPL